jgi:ABC-type lipoprotein export system ATPase subunit
MIEKVFVYEVHQLTKIYDTGKAKIKALDDASFTVPEGDVLAIMGRSGSGKSTLLRQMGLLDRPTSGSVFFEKNEVTKLPEGERTRMRLRYMGYVFQEYALLGELTAYQNVCLPGMMLGAKNGNYKERAKELLEVVGLIERIQHYPKELSGGEQQRVAIARALVGNPMMIFADEPTGNLDTKSSREIMSILKKLNSDGKTLIVVTHDPEIAKWADRTIRLRDGRIITDEN